METPDDPNRAADERDVAARARDAAAETRDEATAELTARNQNAVAEDRAAAALDREESALERRGAANRLQSAYRDDLTGVLSRDAGHDQLSQAVDRAHRIGEQLVIAFLDVDHLKRINDAHGHAGGDDLLRKLGAALRERLRSYDVLVRYGGDEFVCALMGSGLEPAEERFRGLARALAEGAAGASVSVGFAELRADEALDDVIDRADRDMYERRAASRATERRSGRSS
jgi:diguanylate cyclase (GGDEF)-like protein